MTDHPNFYVKKIDEPSFLPEPNNRAIQMFYHEGTAWLTADHLNQLAYANGATEPLWTVVAMTAEEAKQFYEDRMDEAPIRFYPAFAQRNPKWAGDLLGYSKTVTIGGYGCLLCSVASFASHARLDRFEIEPPEANERLKQAGGFVAGTGLMLLSQIPAAFPWIKNAGILDYPYPKSADTAKIDAHLAAGGYAVVKVDFKPDTSALDEHWVLILGKVGDEERYHIIDPWHGSKFQMPPAYAKPGWLARHCIYKVAMYERA